MAKIRCPICESAETRPVGSPKTVEDLGIIVREWKCKNCNLNFRTRELGIPLTLKVHDQEGFTETFDPARLKESIRLAVRKVRNPPVTSSMVFYLADKATVKISELLAQRFHGVGDKAGRRDEVALTLDSLEITCIVAELLATEVGQLAQLRYLVDRPGIPTEWAEEHFPEIDRLAEERFAKLQQRGAG